MVLLWAELGNVEQVWTSLLLAGLRYLDSFGNIFYCYWRKDNVDVVLNSAFALVTRRAPERTDMALSPGRVCHDDIDGAPHFAVDAGKQLPVLLLGSASVAFSSAGVHAFASTL